ncbi:tetratricopeptide repeat-containing diguanylate cyclase [Kinneretia aquatilis]|uniref:tetratricopeptide repeat-containing diguanylate cyclase n=1 Tax=Kinneretia aquatilis TaxID=2070761 RepID=UPI0014950808|nr:tetratricopeptide repeat-containing diguanylate cyclase [Paucibacter aquatile]WIV96354.1 diguanylate cyclase [Paucibacter aquatile]
MPSHRVQRAARAAVLLASWLSLSPLAAQDTRPPEAAMSGAAPAASAARLSPTAWPYERSFDDSLELLLRQGFDRPEQALQRVRAMQKDRALARHSLPLLLAEGRLLVLAGEFTPAQALADRLAQHPQARDAALLLQAEWADRQGQGIRATALARQALAGLSLHCPSSASLQSVQASGVGGRSALPAACDFRLSWSALRLIERNQIRSGTLPLAEATVQWALALAQAGGDRHLAANSMGTLAMLAQMQDQAEQAKRWLVQARQLAQGDALALFKVKNYEAFVASHRQDHAAKLRALEECVELARQADAPRWLAQAQSNLADAYLQLKQPARALEVARQALPLFEQRGDIRIQRTIRHNMAVAYVQLGDYEQARREVARIEAMSQGLVDQGLRVQELRELGEAWTEAGQFKEGLAAYHLERRLSAELVEMNRASALQQLQLKYDSERKQRDLELLQRDQALVDHQLANRQRVQQVGVAVALLLGLSLILVAAMVQRVRAAHKRLRANEQLLKAQSERDPLTDLANRRHFLAVMQEHARREFHGALLMVDIDHFKHVNDQHGHGVGDVVICEVARRLSLAVRAEDLVVRWGGEEFLVFAPGIAPEDLLPLAQRVLQGIGGEPVASSEGPLRITVSIGCAHFPLQPSGLPQHWEQAVNWADMALYTAKSRGRNRAAAIVTVKAGDRQALQQIEADFDAACSSERVQLQQVLGPGA